MLSNSAIFCLAIRVAPHKLLRHPLRISPFAVVPGLVMADLTCLVVVGLVGFRMGFSIVDRLEILSVLADLAVFVALAR